LRTLVRHASWVVIICSAILASSSTPALASSQTPLPRPIPAPRAEAVTTAPTVALPSPVTLVATAPVRIVEAAPAEPPVSILETHQVVSFYGYPGYETMGELGVHDPLDAAVKINALAAEYDSLNGSRDTIGALHLIVDVAQAGPTDDGLYLDRMNKQQIAQYVELARDYGLLLFVDLQIGWSDPLQDVQRLEWFLREPFVHLALDPEFATARFGYAPGQVIGALDADEVNAVQHYLATLVEDAGIPPKLLVLHQFKQSMLIEPERYDDVPSVEITIDMDGFGGAGDKISGFEFYSRSDYAERSAFKLFYHWDLPLLTVQEVVDLDVDYVIYQ